MLAFDLPPDTPPAVVRAADPTFTTEPAIKVTCKAPGLDNLDCDLFVLFLPETPGCESRRIMTEFLRSDRPA